MMSPKRPLDDQARAEAPGEFILLTEGYTHYQVDGPAEGPPVVLIHGFSTPMFIWDPLYQALVQAGARVLRYDLYGRGYSDRPPGPYHRDRFDRQLAELLDALDWPRPTGLAGLSMGGAIAAVYTQRRPHQVSRLLLLDPAGLPMPETWQQRLARMPILGDLLFALLGDRILLGGLKKDFKEPGDLETYIERYRVQMQFPGFKRALLSTLRSGLLTNTQDAFQALSQLDIPILILWGEEDQVVPLEVGRTLQHLLPRAAFHTIPNAGHIPHREQPERVIPLVKAFLLSE